MFRLLTSPNFPPFGNFKLEIKPVPEKPVELAEVHLLTGINGTGKTRLLTVLSAVLGNTQHLTRRVKGGLSIELKASEQLVGPVPYGCTIQDKNWKCELTVQLANWGPYVPAFAYSGSAYLSDASIAPMGSINKPDRAACLSFWRPESSSATLLQGIANLKVQAAMDSMNSSFPQANSRAARIVDAMESSIREITGFPFTFKVSAYPNSNLSCRMG